MKNLILLVKGFFMGIANIIPGVSGGTIAIILGIYEQFIASISNFFKNLKENLKFLVPVALGIGLSILIMSGVINYSYEHFPLPTMLFFVGLVIGGIPMLCKNVKGKKESKEISLDVSGYIILFLVGVVAAATMVIPGISGSLMLMLLGYYYPVIRTINDLVKLNNIGQNILILGVFGAGVLIGIVLISKLLEMLFAKYNTKTYFGVLGFIFASIIAIPISTFLENKGMEIIFSHAIVGVVLLIVGALISYKLGDK